MGRYRDRLQIIADVLSIAATKAGKTKIMYQANLSYTLLCQYLSELQEAKLVSLENNEHYVLTPKGKEFLSRHLEYSSHCKSLEKKLNHVNSEKALLEEMCPDR